MTEQLPMYLDGIELKPTMRFQDLSPGDYRIVSHQTLRYKDRTKCLALHVKAPYDSPIVSFYVIMPRFFSKSSDAIYI